MTRCIVILLLTVFSFCITHDANGEYQLTVLATVGDTIDGKILTSIGERAFNNAGDVVYKAAYSGGEAIFSGDDILVATGDIVGGKLLSSIGPFGINGLGDVAFRGTFSGGQGIFKQDSLIAETGDMIGGLTLLDAAVPMRSPSINSSGDVAFVGAIAGGFALFTQDQLIAAPFSVIDGKTLADVIWGAEVGISEAGLVTFSANYIENSGQSPGFFSQDELLVFRDIEIGGVTLNGWKWNKLNEGGGLGVHAIDNTGIPEETILIDGISLVSEGDIIDGKLVTAFASHSMNDFGDVVFSARTPVAPASSGIFTPTELVAGPGAIVDGGILSREFGGPIINNSGSVLFSAEFLDGRKALVLAGQVIPEPSSLVLALTALVGVMLLVPIRKQAAY